MTDYAILLDGERVTSIDSDSAVRAWLTGGKLVDRQRFL